VLTMVATQKDERKRAPLCDTIIHAVARFVDDAQEKERRDPSHSSIESQIDRAGLKAGDPSRQRGAVPVGKRKRVTRTLSWALENARDEGEIFVAGFVALIKGGGGFRSTSPNFVGEDVLTDAISAFKHEGFTLSADGELYPTNLDTLSGVQLTDALEAYARRARQGDDSALLVGTGKDLLEATAAHVIAERLNMGVPQVDFPTLLGQAFSILDLSTPATPARTGEAAQCRVERSLYDGGCAVNGLRNKQGTGHGHPWLPNVTPELAHAAIQQMGLVSAYLLSVHKAKP
jgi:hypothetical protein